ncbi:hypothetical protein ACFE04_031747 [Oxalis oulophora]
MYGAKEKISNLASAAKEKVKICGAKAEEKADKATARTKEEKAIVHENKKAKEAQAKMELHHEKAQHAQDKLSGKYGHYDNHHHHHAGQVPIVGNEPAYGYGVGGQHQNHHHHHHLGATAPTAAGTGVPAYPVAGNPYPVAGNPVHPGRNKYL